MKVAVLVSPPPVAEIVTTVDVSKGAVEDAVRETVAEHVGLQLTGVNALAVTPGGSGFGILNVIGVVDPASRVVATVSTPPGPPGKIVRVGGVVARQTSNAPPVPQVTTRLKVVVLVMPPPVAWMVMVVFEPGAVEDAVSITVAEHVGIQLTGVKALAPTPVGSGLVMLNVTEGATPATRVALTVSVSPAPPGMIVKVEGEGARLI